MNKFRFFLVLFITIALIVILNLRLSGKPAFGKLLNPTTGFWTNAESSEFYLPKVVALENLNKKTEVFFDEKRIPHIFAESEHDLYFVQGYVVASLRLWQMEFQVLAADGRISEILGGDEKYINFDKNQRRLGLGFGAKNKLEVLEKDPLALDLLNAYKDGINAYIENMPAKDLPLEYKLLGYKPEPWTNYKTMLVLMNMTKILADAGDDIENTNFVDKYGKELYDQLYPSNINVEPVIPTPDGGWLAKFGMDTSKINTDSTQTNLKTDTSNMKLAYTKDPEEYHIGSNNWAVSGAKTKSGKPLLSNDPHLKFSLPSVWIEMHLVGPNSNAYGVTFPGSPGITIGFNENIGWGMTNSGRDVKDFYTVEYKDATKELYHYQNEWVKSEFVVEEIKVRGAKSVLDTVIYTKFGPVLHTDFETQNGKKDIAVQWMGHSSSQEYMMFYLLNKAKNFDDYLAATKYFSCPAQNMVFACVDGDIALRNQGKFPINEFEQSKFMQTSNEGKVWDNFIPFAHNPMQHNPASGFVASANQESTDNTYPYYYNGGFEDYRNRVINKNLSDLKNATVQDMIALQMNNFNMKASESLPTMLQYVNTKGFDFEAQDVFTALKTWDFYNDIESTPAIYYELFFEKYEELLWDEFGDGLKAPSEEQTIYLLQDSIQHRFIDNASTTKIETQADLITEAFKFAAVESQKYKGQNWGQYNDVSFGHVASLEAFSRKVVYGGNNHIVNATRKTWGPSWRMILDFAGGKIKGIGIYPGGESGNPGSKHYDDMLDDWAVNKFHELENTSSRKYFEDKGYFKVAFLTKE